MPPGEAEMLEFLGLKAVEDLFSDIPEDIRIDGLDIAPGTEEAEIVEKVRLMLSRNRSGEELLSFLGAGYYDMYVPAVVDAIVSRSEFYTAYTPYQAEISQGLQQALFEYQSLICELTGMDGANSSLYDGSSALGEAALMTYRISRRKEFLVPKALHWEKAAVLRNYAGGAGLQVREVAYESDSGVLDYGALRAAVGGETGGIYVENPNFFGLLDQGVLGIKEDFPECVVVVGINPLAQALLKGPGEYGADIVIGEGQPLGNWVNFGGPSLGIFACRREYIRKMPGRVIGLTRDSKGDRAFCMTLQTREQHIRRERAMSNICTNESLLAVAAAVYMASMGESGLRQLGRRLIEGARELMAAVDRVDGFSAPLFDGHYFNEFPVHASRPWREVHQHLTGRDIIGGLDLNKHFPSLGSSALFAVTDRHSRRDFDRLAHALEEF